MGTSPFRRRPALTRTYGSARPSAAAAPSSSSNPTTARRTSAHAGELTQDASTDSDAEEVVVTRTMGAPAAATGSSSTAPRGKGRDKGDGWADQRAGSKTSASTASKVRPSPTRRTRSTSTAAVGKDMFLASTNSGSTVWDAEAALATKPAGPSRRASARLAGGATEEEGSAPSGRATLPSPTRRRSAASAAAAEPDSANEAAATAPPKKRPRLSVPLSARSARAPEDADDIPPPVDYVPLAERLKRASLTKATSPAPLPVAKAPTAYVPTLRRTRSSSRLVDAASPPPLSPAPARMTTTAPRTARPASPLRRTVSTSAAAAGGSKAASPAAEPQAGPPSPAKDLSAIFSRFAPPAPTGAAESLEKGPAASGAGTKKARVLLKRSQSGGAALGSAGSGRMRAELLGKNWIAGESVVKEEEEAGSAPTSPTRTRTPGLDRSRSQPNLHSSPLPSPTRSPARSALGASLSFPKLGGSHSPSRSRGESPNPFSPRRAGREASPSPVRPALLGSAYLPLAFAPPANVGIGAARTYAGGARTLRRDVAEEALFAPLATAPSSSVGSSTAAAASGLPSLPPALSRRTRGAHAPAPAQDLDTLRTLWGIDAEESLADAEEAESQDRGARVVAGGLLRKQGEGKRWMDEMGWCLEGLRGGERSAARASALDLLTKLLSRDWLRQLKSSGQAETVYVVFRLAASPTSASGADRVLDTAMAVLVALLVRDQRLAEPLFRLRAADIAREADARGSADAEGEGEDVGAEEVKHALRSEASGTGWSSSPRKAGAGEEDEGSDLLEVLRELGGHEWAGEEIGVAKGDGEVEGGRGTGKKVLKGDARHLQSLRNIIDAAELFLTTADRSAQPVTIRALVLLATRSIAAFSPRAIFQPQHMLCESGVFEQVVQVFLDECSGIQDRLAKYEKGLDLLPPPDLTAGSHISLATLSTCLSIFESTSLATPYAFHVISSPTLLQPVARALEDLALASFLVALDAPVSSVDDATRTEALNVLTAVLGILFGLTTESAWGVPLVRDGSELLRTLVCVVLACRRVAAEREKDEDDVVAAALVPLASARKASMTSAPSSEVDAEVARSEAAEDEPADAEAQAVWDVLSLALGVLANLAESAGEELKVRVRELRLVPSCHGKRTCARVCRCASHDDEAQQASMLEILAQLALDPLADAPNSVYQHSVTGFLRLLLGLLILDSPQNEELLLAALSASPDALAPVLDALEDLAKLHDEQRRAREEMALPPPERDDELDGRESQCTEVDEAQDTEMTELRGEGDAETDLPIRMRELVQRLRRRIG